jgi:hypothetical protein
MGGIIAFQTGGRSINLRSQGKTKMPIEPQKEAIELFGLEKERECIQQAIGRFKEGDRSNMAVIAEPFSGRTTLVQEIQRTSGEKITYIPYYSVISEKGFLTEIENAESIVILDNCHFLAQRKIGGFDRLDEFLRFLINSERLFITTWNSFAWSYLDHVMKISAFFPVTVMIPQISEENIKQMILSQYDTKLHFVSHEERPDEKMVSRISRSIPLPFSSQRKEIPWIRINLGKRERKAVEDLVFDRLNKIAKGNPGVARIIWERYMSPPEIVLENIPDLPCTVDLDVNEAFLLINILSMESIQERDLREIAGSEFPIDKALFRLRSTGLVDETDGYYSIRPEALRCVVEFLKRARMVW